jgi:hypothetical protein
LASERRTASVMRIHEEVHMLQTDADGKEEVTKSTEVWL